MSYANKLLNKMLSKTGLDHQSIPTSTQNWNDFLNLVELALQESYERKLTQERTMDVFQKEMDRIYLELKKYSEAEINKQKAKYEILAKAVDAAAIVAVTDPAGIITEVNDLFCEISGYSRQELIGKTHSIIKSGYHHPDVYKEMWTTIKSGSIWRGEIYNKRKDGRYYWVDTTIVPELNDQDHIIRYIAIRFDITSRKNTEYTLVSASKMASLGEMAAGMAHEINNPLTIISGLGSRLEMKIQKNNYDPVLFLKDVKTINDTVQRIAKIVRGLRSFSRSGEQDPFDYIDLDKVVSETLSLCYERFKNNGVQLKVESTPKIRIQCRAVQVSQVLLNLLNNAYDAIEKTELPWVSLTYENVIYEGKEFIRINVTDSGKGIPLQIAEKLMQPFFTTKSVGKGTGLGLSISRGIVVKHQGRFWLDQDCPHTRFVVELPLSQNK